MNLQDFKDRDHEIEQYVQEAQSGKTEAFAKIYDAFINPIYKYIYFKVPKDDALDLTEAVFLKIWENLSSYKKQKVAFSAWVFKIAHNLVVDHYRLQKDAVPIEELILQDESKESDPVYLAERSLSRGSLRVALSKIKNKYRQILLLKYVSDLSNEEIAKILKKNEGTIRILKFRALQALKRALEEMNITY